MQGVGMELLLDIEMGRKSLLKKAYSSRDLNEVKEPTLHLSREKTRQIEETVHAEALEQVCTGVPMS